MFSFKAVRSLEAGVIGEEFADSEMDVRPLTWSLGAFGGVGGAMLARVVSMRVVKNGRPAAPLRVLDVCETMDMKQGEERKSRKVNYVKVFAETEQNAEVV